MQVHRAVVTTMPNVQYVMPHQSSPRGTALQQQQLTLLTTEEKQLRLQQVQRQKAQLLHMYAQALQQQALQQQHKSALAEAAAKTNSTGKVAAEDAEVAAEQPSSAQPADSMGPANLAAVAPVAATSVQYYPARLPNGMLVMVPGTMVVPQLQQQQFMSVVPSSSLALPKLKVPSCATVTSRVTGASSTTKRPAEAPSAGQGGLTAPTDNQQAGARSTTAEPSAKRARTAQAVQHVRKVVQTYQDLLDDDDVTTEEEDDTDDPVETPLSLPGLTATPDTCQPGTRVASANVASSYAAAVVLAGAPAGGIPAAAHSKDARQTAPVAELPTAADEDREAAEILVELLNSSTASTSKARSWSDKHQQQLVLQQQLQAVSLQKPALGAAAAMLQLTPAAAAIAAAAAAGLRAAAAKDKVQPTMEAAAIAVQEVVKNLLQQHLNLQH